MKKLQVEELYHDELGREVFVLKLQESGTFLCTIKPVKESTMVYMRLYREDGTVCDYPAVRCPFEHRFSAADIVFEEFEVDGPGLYQTRDGRTAEVVGVLRVEGTYPVKGFSKTTVSASWTKKGLFHADEQNSQDLVRKISD